MISKHTVLRLMFLLAIALFCGACAGVRESIPPLPDLISGDVQLTILDDTYIDGGSFDSLSLNKLGATDYEVSVLGARNLKALYLEIRFDSVERSYLRTRPTEFWGPEDNYLTLSVPGDPGYAEFGLIMIHPEEKAGVSGDGVLARISFTTVP